MKRLCALIMFSSLLFLVISPFPALSSPNGRIRLYFKPELKILEALEPGESVNFTVDVYVSNIEDVYSYQLVIKYNTTFLTVYDVEFPSGYIFEGKQTIPMEEMIEPDYGYILIGITLLGGASGVTVPENQERIIARLLCSVNKTGTTYLTIATKDKPVKIGMYTRYTYFMNSKLQYIEITSTTADIGTCGITLGVKMPPIAAFEIIPSEPLVNQTVIFNASKSLDPDGYIRYYYWKIERGGFYNILNTKDPVVYYNFTYPGRYNVTLQVVDNDNLTSSASQEVKVNYLPGPFDISELYPLMTVILVVSVTFVILYGVIKVRTGQRFKE